MGDSGYYDDDDDTEFHDGQGDGPKPLRDQLKKLQRDLKKAQADLEARDETIAGFTKTQRKQSLTDLLTAKGVRQPGKAATLAEKFDVEASEDSVNTWLAEYGDLLGVTEEETQESRTADARAAQLPEEDDSDEYERTTRDGFEGHSRASRGEARPSGIQDELAKLDDPNLSYDDVIKRMREIPGLQVGRSYE